MAGHNFDFDPALLKYNSVIQSRHKYFRWTPRTARITFAYMFAFPAFIGFLAYRYEGKWDMRGKRRGDTIVEF